LQQAQTGAEGPSRRDAAALVVQRAVGRLLSPLWFPATIGAMRFGFRWRIEGVAAVRAEYRALRREGGPLLVCANHLTLIDSALVAWALGSPGWFLFHYAALPWNVPERRNFASSRVSRVLVYVMKCVPIVRGGDRAAIGRVLARLARLLQGGEAVLIFPEGGRSRTGSVEPDSAAYGVGRLVAAVPDCRVLCVYLRGLHQEAPGDFPVRGERFRVRTRCIAPSSPFQGMRRARDLAGRIVAVLAELEREHFAEISSAAPDPAARFPRLRVGEGPARLQGRWQAGT
jgi:1-acyl-sn-glycerol-3-phosphate acyltransferase